MYYFEELLIIINKKRRGQLRSTQSVKILEVQIILINRFTFTRVYDDDGVKYNVHTN